MAVQDLQRRDQILLEISNETGKRVEERADLPHQNRYEDAGAVVGADGEVAVGARSGHLVPRGASETNPVRPR